MWSEVDKANVLFCIALSFCICFVGWYKHRNKLRNHYKINHGEEVIFCYSFSICNGWVRAYDFDNNVIGRFRTTKVNIEKI